MQKNGWLLLIFLLLPHVAIAQTGNCEAALAEAYLDAGNVRARILNNGGLFWRGSPHVYEVPKGSGLHANWAAGIWVGGMINNSLRVAASRYGPWEFWAGPLDEAGNPPSDCKPYDQIWEIRTEDIQTFIDGNGISNNLKNWPWQLGAPIVDGDGNPDNYNLEGGDLPELFGDQRLWWIMNDRGNVHQATDSDPIGLEVHASAHAFDHPGFISNTTFYSYRLINKNTAPFEHAFFGFFKDFDLGNFDDDYVGSDSLLHLSYGYNGDNDDEGGEGYGTAPPAIGFTFLDAESAPPDNIDNDRDGEIDEEDEKIGAYGMLFYHGGGAVSGDPTTGRDYYRYMQSHWKDNKPLYKGYMGYDWGEFSDTFPTETTRFSYSGDPTTKDFWTEFNVNGNGLAHAPANRRSVFSSGPYTIASFDTVEVRLAIVWSRGKDNLDSVAELKKDVKSIRDFSDSFYSPRTYDKTRGNEITPSFTLGFDQNFPNPFTQSTTLRYSLPQAMQVRLAVYDMLGREVAILVDAQQEAGAYTAAFDAGDLPAGIYLARIDLDFLRFTKRMVLLR
ncbi:MAG: T9SS type A sorting domain-containing protein [Bacteroidota bacterium]